MKWVQQNCCKVNVKREVVCSGIDNVQLFLKLMININF